jgi:hypothetical protein
MWLQILLCSRLACQMARSAASQRRPAMPGAAGTRDSRLPTYQRHAARSCDNVHSLVFKAIFLYLFGIYLFATNSGKNAVIGELTAGCQHK